MRFLLRDYNGFDSSAVCRASRQKLRCADASGTQIAFELYGREIAEGRVSPAGVLPAFDPFEDGKLGLRVRVEAPSIQQFTLQRSEEALGHRIIVRITH